MVFKFLSFNRLGQFIDFSVYIPTISAKLGCNINCLCHYFTAETHRWKLDDSCTISCWDELKFTSLDVANFNNTNTMMTSHLILNPENFMSISNVGFSVGFWLVDHSKPSMQG